MMGSKASQHQPRKQVQEANSFAHTFTQFSSQFTTASDIFLQLVKHGTPPTLDFDKETLFYAKGNAAAERLV